MKRIARHVAAMALAAAAATGCENPISGASDDTESGPVAAAPKFDGAMAKEAWSGVPPSHTKLEIKGIERHDGKSVLRYFMTSLGNKRQSLRFGTSLASDGPDFYLVDPVGRKAYSPHRGPFGHPAGSKLRTFAEPGVRYAGVLYFPPIPSGVRSLTVVTSSTAGEYTGVPVTGAKSEPEPGAKAFPVDERVKRPGSVNDLYGITEGEEKSSSSSGSEETVGLRTDVLFAFDSANLSPRAKTILDDVAKETRAKADPAKPPISVEGHTDGRGTRDYNVRLSQQRAEAVRKELGARLGDGYQYRTEGKAETEPIAKEGGADDERARQKNRRVEISYKIKQRTPGSEGTKGTKTEESTSGKDGRPARFSPRDGKTVASRTADFGAGIRAGKRRLDVRPMYRDGSYLVVPFEIANLGPGKQTALDDYSGDFIGHHFSDFKVIDPASKTAYRGVRIGPDKAPDGSSNLNYVDPGWATFRLEPGTSNRGFFYVPAPPSNVTRVTFDGGQFGQIPDVPIN